MEYNYHLSPRAPDYYHQEWWFQFKYYAWVRFYGVHVSHSPFIGELPASFAWQNNDNQVLIGFDSVADAGEYEISEYREHSSIEIGIILSNTIPKGAEVSVMITLEGNGDIAEAYIFTTKERDYTINGFSSFDVNFHKPIDGNWMQIILIRPKTGFLSFVKANGWIGF